MYEFTKPPAPKPPPVMPPAPRLPVPPPPRLSDVTILRYCRCQDCLRWDTRQGRCWDLGFTRYVPKEEYPKAMQRFWTDLGMVRPEDWHYCAQYDGPQVSKDVWVWPRRVERAEVK